MLEGLVGLVPLWFWHQQRGMSALAPDCIGKVLTLIPFDVKGVPGPAAPLHLAASDQTRGQEVCTTSIL